MNWIRKNFWWIVLTIVAAIVWSYFIEPRLFNYEAATEVTRRRPQPTVDGETDVPFLKATYTQLNETYFGNKLPKDTLLATDLGDSDMANTDCDDMGQNCIIRFNLRYTMAQRVSEGSLVHEMCHIKVWVKHVNKPSMTDKHHWDHNESWRACMLTIDTAGEFRDLNIDYYREK